MEQMTYNMLFRWFIGLSMDAPVWDVTVFTKNRERLLAGDVAGRSSGRFWLIPGSSVVTGASEAPGIRLDGWPA